MQVESLVGNAGALKRVYGYRKARKKKTKTNISEHCILANRRFSFETPNDRRLEDGGPRTLTNNRIRSGALEGSMLHTSLFITVVFL